METRSKQVGKRVVQILLNHALPRDIFQQYINNGRIMLKLYYANETPLTNQVRFKASQEFLTWYRVQVHAPLSSAAQIITSQF